MTLLSPHPSDGPCSSVAASVADRRFGHVRQTTFGSLDPNFAAQEWWQQVRRTVSLVNAVGACEGGLDSAETNQVRYVDK